MNAVAELTNRALASANGAGLIPKAKPVSRLEAIRRPVVPLYMEVTRTGRGARVRITAGANTLATFDYDARTDGLTLVKEVLNA